MWGLAKSHFLPHYHRKIYKKSAVFHAQINKQYHEYHIRNVNSETLNLVCVVKWKKVLEIMELFCEENNFDDPVHLCNFAAKFSNYDENASVFKPQLQLTVL